MDIEELVKKHIKRNGWSFSHDGECADAMRAALTEQAEAYEQRILSVRNELLLAEERLAAANEILETFNQRIRELEEQMVPKKEGE